MDKDSLPFFSRFVKRGDLCFDIGANAGDRSHVFRQLGARVVAVEPQQDCVTLLRSRFGADDGVIILDAALADFDGYADLLIGSSRELATLSQEWVERSTGVFGRTWEGSEQVPVTTLDALIRDNGLPSFIKIDVEGYELKALSGLSKPVPALSFEVNSMSVDWACACLQNLERFGEFQANLDVLDDHNFVFDEWCDSSGMQKTLRAYVGPIIFGDVYVRFRNRW